MTNQDLQYGYNLSVEEALTLVEQIRANLQARYDESDTANLTARDLQTVDRANEALFNIASTLGAI